MAIEAFDAASGWIAPAFKSDAAMWTDAFAPELLVWLEELPAGLFLTNVGRILLGLAFGFGAIAATTMMAGRDKEALMHMGSHWLTHPNAPGLYGIAAASVATPQALASELQSLRQGFATGNFDLARSSLAFSPADIDSYFRSVSNQWSALFAPGQAAVPLAPAVGAAAAATPEAIAAQVASVVGYGDVF